MAEKITFGDLRRLLETCGFDQRPVDRPYVVYMHPTTGAVQAFRAHRVSELADAMTLASVRKTLIGFGILDEDAWEESLRDSAAGHGPKTKRG
jgi:tryptophan synthase alpha subunit